MKKIYTQIVVLLSVLILPISFLNAQITGGPTGGGLQNPLKPGIDTLPEFIAAFLDIIIQIGLPLVVLAIVYAGFLFVKAQGKPEDLEKAKTAFFWTIVGALILLGAKVISELVSATVSEIIR